MYAYLVAAVVSLSLIVGAFFFGRDVGIDSVRASQLQDYKDLITAEAEARKLRIQFDSDARAAAEKFTKQVRKDLNQVKDDFNGIPMVTIGGDGCSDLSDAFRLRWNAAESAGAVRPSTGLVDDSLR